MNSFVNKKIIIGVIALSFVLAILPAVRLVPELGMSAFGDAYTTTYTSYLTRIHEIKDGNAFIGNPYFFEHSTEPAVSFFVADWLAAIPYLLGLPLGLAMFINLFFWLIIFCLLTIVILRTAGLSERLSLLAGAVSLATCYLLLVIPVSMQIITPCYAFFLLTLILWLQDPGSNKRGLMLVVGSVLPFYLYTYLWQITYANLFILLFILLVLRRWDDSKRLLLLIGATMLACLPQIVYTIIQLKHFAYWETMTRIGFVPTHIPTSRSLIYALWTLLIVAFAYIQFRGAQTKERGTILFIISAGLGLFAAQLSNVITGKELELGQHIPRFIVYFAPLSLAMILVTIKNSAKKWIALGLLALPLLTIIPDGYQSFFNGDSAKGAISEIEYQNKMSGILNWLNENESQSAVVAVLPRNVFAEEAIPTFTRHYDMFASTGILHLLTTKETLERYLITQILAPKTKQELWDYREEFAGIGNTTHFRTVTVRRQKFCNLMSKIDLDQKFDICVHPIPHPLTPEFFDQAYELEQKIVANPEPYFKKYHVKYLLLESGPLPKELSKLNLTNVYSDSNFSLEMIVYKK